MSFKNKKPGITLLALLIYFSSLSQTYSVVDKDGDAVSYATIEVPKKGIAFFADVKGNINIPSEITTSDSLVISAIGCVSLKIAVKDINDKIILERQVKELQEVFVYNGEWKKENWGSKKKPRIIGGFGCSWQLNGPGSQIGRVIKSIDEKKRPALIYQVSFYTTHAKETRSPARLRVYGISETGLPDKDILQETLVENIDKNSGWLTFDLTGKEITVPDEGLIVAAEYFDTDTKNWNSEKVNYQDSTGNMSKKTVTWYGGNFATNDETEQGPSLMRYIGHWIQLGTNGRNPKCDNLVVRVWVKYPESKN